ncbi:MAG: hypothetical protein COA50_05520 [Flavobacteriaceae bacterium]|nr:MAG: hypothetical protein COA50_05520 [Flavobacteriaceae bacterium]
MRNLALIFLLYSLILSNLEMNKIGFGIVVISVFIMISCKSQKVSSQGSEESPSLNYNVESPSSHAQVVNDTKADRDLTHYLRGVSGVRVVGNGANAEITIRGNNSLNLSNEPLYILNGQQYYGSFASLYELVPPDQIKSVTVLKDAGTLGIYGSNAVNGVIEIITAN